MEQWMINTPKSLSGGCGIELQIQPELARAESTPGKGLEEKKIITLAFQFSKQPHLKYKKFCCKDSEARKCF